jgi:2-polyprenyl-3-methyl-5-hydroxy-6-metoxy-1,4-benzoquinol methylase
MPNPYANNPIIPRLHLKDASVRPETVRHHMKRYELAANHVRIGQVAVDLCCGTGYGTDLLAQAGAAATGIDLSREAIDHAQRSYPDAAFKRGRVQDFLRSVATKPNVVTFFEAIEHIPRPDGHDVLDAVQGALNHRTAISSCLRQETFEQT